MFSSKKVQQMIKIVSESLAIKDQLVEESLNLDNNRKIFERFVNFEGPPKIFFYYQAVEQQNQDDIKDPGIQEQVLFVTYGESEKIKGKAVFFFRQFHIDTVPSKQDNLEDILWGEINPKAVQQLNIMVDRYYGDLLLVINQTDPNEEGVKLDPKDFIGECDIELWEEFCVQTERFAKELKDTTRIMSPGQNLFQLEQEDEQFLTQKVIDQNKVPGYEKIFSEWIIKITQLLNNDQDLRNQSPDAGPDTELNYWKTRMQNITHWSEQLKSPAFQKLRHGLQKYKQNQQGQKRADENISKLMGEYNKLDLLLTDQLNEAKDNVKYLTTLEKFIEPLYNGTAQQIIDTLPALMNAIKMIHTIARFYNTADKMTGLFMKITNQMIKNCKEKIILTKDHQDIWKRDTGQLIEVLQNCVKLYTAYKQAYNKTKENVADMPKGKTFDFSETQIFGKFDSFVRRLNKIQEIFSNIQQFKALEKHNLEGMEKLTADFQKIIKDFMDKKHDLLNTNDNAFDRDWVEFNVDVSQLDTKLQQFIDNNFNRFRNIEYSLKLLKKFSSTIQRASLKQNLENKYNAILYNYATELDNIQHVFHQQKSNPPIVRNMPPEAGKIIWSRHLFQKITGPIDMFPENIKRGIEIKRYYGAYNSLGKQLTIYEMWYYQNWVNEIERSKAALQATLIVRHQEHKKLYVNFDLEIMQLIREAKCLDRQGIEIPESARIILLQEEKFKHYYNELLYVLKEYERIISKIKPICKNLLSPHVEDLEIKLRPGMVTLTWTSMNIESYLERVHEGLNKMEQLIINVNDIIENRIENNLKIVSRIILVNLPQDTKPLGLEDFVDIQEKYIEQKTTFLISKNIEAETAVDDLLATIENYKFDPNVDRPSKDEMVRIKKYYFWYFYQALLNSTQNSLNAMKFRVCGKKLHADSSTVQDLKPFFEVDVQLADKEIILKPSLDEIQKSINKAATAVLRCSKNLYHWDQKDKDKKSTLYDMIAQDKEIVKVILLLTGSIQGTRNKVNEYLNWFSSYEFLFKERIQDKINAFTNKNPSIQDYEDKLKDFTEKEEIISNKIQRYKIGAMELKTEPICLGLISWIKDWKQAFAKDLHNRARAQLQNLTEQTKNLYQNLTRQVKDIDSLGSVMETLEKIRVQQAEIELKFGPVTEMYNLLDTYLAGGITDKDEMDSRSLLKSGWDNLIKQAEKEGKQLEQKQGDYLRTLKLNIKKFIQDVHDFRRQFETEGPMVEGITPNDAIEKLRRFIQQYEVQHTQFVINKRGEDLFGLPHQSYKELEKTDAEIKNLNKLYDLYDIVIKSINLFRDKSWTDTSKDDLNKMEENSAKYIDLCTKLPRDLKSWTAFKDLKQNIDSLNAVLPIIQELKKPSIMPRHWEAICQITKTQLNYENFDNMLIDHLMNAKLLDYNEDIYDITDSADKQLKIRNQLDEIQQFWDQAQFEFGSWGRRDNCMLNGLVVATILERLEEDQTSLTTINAQRQSAPFKAEVEGKIHVFSDINDTLDLWVKVQKLWTSLEPVFTGGDIARQMPLQAKQFSGIDKNWIKIMEKAHETKKVVQSCQNDMLKDFLPDLNQKLEGCQKSLEAYLEGKRKKFPRFYFVSNPTLLKILSQGSDPKSIQEDFEKLFDAITKVTFETLKGKKGSASQEQQITQIQQVLGKYEERVQLIQPVKCEGNIEGWLKTLESSMQYSIKDLARRAGVSIKNSGIAGLKEFVKTQISQIALMGLQILWTVRVTEGLEKVQREKNALELKRREVDQMMILLSEMCLEPNESPVDRTKIETLVTIQVHQKDITKDLKCKDVNDFEWQKQTRLNWGSDKEKDKYKDDCIISITDWDSPYSYEYLGAKERLCITPLTDRCYITLAQAMSMYYGGAPAGPAGTGKTETVKDLGRTLGVFVVVTNCSDQHRYRDMAKIFKGLVQSGLWGCFDEFNRIDLEVLSVVAMQIEAISTARKLHVPEFMFPEEENPIELIPTVGYFITMNPGYAGRQELPENLKVLFRGVSMMMPDREIIIKVKLASVGYKEIDNLAKKFNVLYKLCEEQLSKQRHYDFGLRNILSVLRTAGNTKREERNSDEEMLLMRSLRDMNLSKLVADDIPLFQGLLLDIFPKQRSVPKKTYPQVEKQIPIVVEQKQGFINSESFQLKIIQLYETCLVRHGYMLVGPTGTGKTTIMDILTKALTDIGQPHKIVRMNPKAITAEEMYGVKSEISDDWITGIFSSLWEKSNNRTNKSNTWLTCDGPVDAIWIENLNTVLDDNKILTLANGERIAMTDNCKLVFEVENLNNASPATVSRCGQVYVSPVDLGHKAILEGWLRFRKLNGRAEESDRLLPLFNKYFQGNVNILDFCEKQLKSPTIELNYACKMISTLNILSGCLSHLVQIGKYLTEGEYEKYLVYSLAWSLGGIYEDEGRKAFHDYLWTKGCPIPQKSKDTETIFDYQVATDTNDWRILQPDEWKPPERNMKFSQVLLPTIDSFRAEVLMNLILEQPKSSMCFSSCLLVGGSGTAKTSSVLLYCSKFDQQKLFKRINFSSATQPFMFQSTIEQECDFKVGKDFAPPGNKMMTVFIDDLSMPFVNKWGDQITLELVRQLIEQGGFYMLDRQSRGMFKNIKNLNYIGAMNHPGGGRNDIPNRLKRQFFIFNMILPSSIEGIYGPIIKHIFKPKHYSTEVNRVIDGLTNATIQLWNNIKKTMLPTPSKFHYVFNMRELSRIFKGILNLKKEIINSSSSVQPMKPEVYMVGVWRHECERVFVDKLVNSKDKDIALKFIQDISLEMFGHLENEILDKFEAKKTFLFCDFLKEDETDADGVVQNQGERVYEAVNDIERLRTRCENLLNDYNTFYPSKKMQLVLFDDALRHLLRVSRIIKIARSSALLVGVGGSGKQSLTRLASYIGRYSCQQIVISRTYGEKELKEDIKLSFELSGHKGQNVTFLMTDAEVKKEEFLEYINMVLSTGEIPGLLAKDEKEVWLMDIRNDYVKEKSLGNADPPASDLMNYFVDRVRDNLHIVLCFSPVGQKFRDRARKFPALFNECTIDWFLPWPEEALVSVAEKFINKFSQLQTEQEIKQQLMRHMGNVHLMVNEVCEIYYQKMRRQVYVTPKSYLSYLEAYRVLYINKLNELDIAFQSYKIGLDKIKAATEQIRDMEVELGEEEKLLKAAQDNADKLLIDLGKQTEKANKKGAEVKETKDRCQQQANEIQKDKESAEKDLEAALPALKRAQEAVDSIENKDIVEMKANKNPLEIIRYIMDSVTIFFGKPLCPVQIEDKTFNKKENKVTPFMKDSYEEGGKQTLNDMNFMKNLKNFEKDQINEETIELLQPLFNAKDDWFNDALASRASKAAAGILKWAFAIFEYHDKSKIVKPKQIALVIQQGRLEQALKELKLAEDELDLVNQEIQNLTKIYDNEQEKKNVLLAKAKKTKSKIFQARTLISSLAGEKDRWTKGADEINEQKRRLIGNASLATAFISYCGPFNAEFRFKLANDYFVGDMKKRGIPVTNNLDLTNFLVDDATVGEWNLQGLPKDDLSIQNGIMVTNSSRYPLFIDPQLQGQCWIRKKFDEEGSIDPTYSITTINHPKFKDLFLRFCMEEGKTLIIENIKNEVDPMLDPVLEKQTQKKGKSFIINVGDTEITFNPNFKLFMTCRLANPSFSPELSAKTTIIDFTVTQGGLEQQLLGKVISREQKTLEDSLNQLLTDVNQNKKDLQKLDKNLLERLTQSKGNLIEDNDLMEVLNHTKTQAKEVAAKLLDAEIKTKEINDKREQYRPVAVRGSALYFTMIEVSLINWMYNSSLEQFLKLFIDSIELSEKTQLPSKRVENIIKYLTFNVYRYVNRGLFEQDKISFILMMCFKILTTANKINSNDVSLFLKSGAALDLKAEKAKPSLSFISDKMWLNVMALSRHVFASEPIAFFRELPELVQKNDQAWKGWIDKPDPENFPIPDFSERLLQEKDLGPFLILVIVRSLREDRTLVAATNFISLILGKEYTAPISYPIDTIWSESSNVDPVLFLLSAGADPTSSIDDLAKKKKKFPCEKVSMGEGQEIVAKKVILREFENGGWIILQNCHLGLKFMEEIETLVNKEAKIHEDFRLWITCEQRPGFPLGLLQKTIKVTNEPPKGIKAGLYKTFTTVINQEFLEKVECQQYWHALIYTICYLHSIVIERRKFGPLGWCIPYEFNNSDLEASLLFVEKYLNTIFSGPQQIQSTQNISMPVIKYMVCQVQYGGRITDDLDRELFDAYGDDFLKDVIFNGEYTFLDTLNEAGGGVKEKFRYKIPANPMMEITKYQEYITTIPTIDNPEIFGLHKNADLTFRLKESLEMINTIMDTRPKDSSVGGGKTREEQVKEKASELLNKLPIDYIDNEIREQVRLLPGPKGLQEKGFFIPLNIFLYQELQRMQRVISLVRKTLKDTMEAIDGTIIMTPDILEAINAIFDAKVPVNWLYDPSGAEISWLLPTLGSWFNSLLQRNQQLNEWLKNKRPQTYWLTGFFNPQGFLTAMKQEVTRINSRPDSNKPGEAWSLDDVQYLPQVKEREFEQIRDVKPEGVYIQGLFLEGCKWSKSGLEDADDKKIFNPLPILYVTAINKKKGTDSERMNNLYNCPVYKYPKRTDKYLVFRVALPCEAPGPTKWKLRGVALLCSCE